MENTEEKLTIQLSYFKQNGKLIKTENFISTFSKTDHIEDIWEDIMLLKSQKKLPGVEDYDVNILISIPEHPSNIMKLIPYNSLRQYQSDAARCLVYLENLLMDNLHMVAGILTEGGDLMDVYKKQLAYGKQPDILNTKEEIGDLMWYIANYCRINNIEIEECLELNINKLKVRYPAKFTQENALNRNLDAERSALAGEEKEFNVEHTSIGFLASIAAKNPYDAVSKFLESKDGLNWQKAPRETFKVTEK